MFVNLARCFLDFAEAFFLEVDEDEDEAEDEA